MTRIFDMSRSRKDKGTNLVSLKKPTLCMYE